MNFFAHAIIATSRSKNPRWVLGAMLPDFCSMAGLRLESVHDDQTLAKGVKFHHSSDDAFHGAPRVLEAMNSIRDEMLALGLTKGPAMAIGHVGLELLMDGVLVEENGITDSYQAAIEHMANAHHHLKFTNLDADQGSNRWQHFANRIVTAPVPARYNEPDFVVDRLIQILASRPYLSIPIEFHAAVHLWAHRATSMVTDLTPKLLEQVEQRLSATL